MWRHRPSKNHILRVSYYRPEFSARNRMWHRDRPEPALLLKQRSPCVRRRRRQRVDRSISRERLRSHRFRPVDRTFRAPNRSVRRFRGWRAQPELCLFALDKRGRLWLCEHLIWCQPIRRDAANCLIAISPNPARTSPASTAMRRR